MSVLMVALGGALVAVCRYLLGLIPLGERYSFPFITLIINFAGAFLIAIVAFGGAKYNISNNLNLFLKVGVCGGFTTFSTFSIEAFNLLDRGSYLLAVGYILASVLLCLGAVLLGKIIIS